MLTAIPLMRPQIGAARVARRREDERGRHHHQRGLTAGRRSLQLWS